MATKSSENMTEPTENIEEIVENSRITVYEEEKSINYKKATFTAPVDGVLIFELNNEASWMKSKTVEMSVHDENKKIYIAPVDQKSGSSTSLAKFFLYGVKHQIDGVGTLDVATNNTFTMRNIPKAKTANVVVQLEEGQVVEWKMNLEYYDIKFKLYFQMDWVKYQQTVKDQLAKLAAQSTVDHGSLNIRLAEIESLKADIKSMTDAKETTEKKLRDLEKENEQLKENETTRVQRLNKLQPQVEEYQAEIASKQKEIDQLNDRLLKYQALNSSLKDKVKEFKEASEKANEVIPIEACVVRIVDGKIVGRCLEIDAFHTCMHA
jgi:hypothetical protein